MRLRSDDRHTGCSTRRLPVDRTDFLIPGPTKLSFPVIHRVLG
ncbi:hypothetical protein MKSMC1_29500 [Mycobacterium kansasii]|nr:hypothetical protein MKSMC1_29500 [Mycobacterium kansasii]